LLQILQQQLTMAQRAAVFSSYRRLYRARISLFRGDEEAMRESRQAVRAQYLQHGTAAVTDLTHFQSLLGMADEAADMLRHSIVRGNLNAQTGHYGTCMSI
jgi:complex III assembly factor LYRM7